MRDIWLEQITPVLMQMANDTRGDGKTRGVLLPSPGRCMVQIVVQRVTVENGDVIVQPKPCTDVMQQIEVGDGCDG